MQKEIQMDGWEKEGKESGVSVWALSVVQK